MRSLASALGSGMPSAFVALEVILQIRALTVLLHLMQRRLPHIEDCLLSQMIGGNLGLCFHVVASGRKARTMSANKDVKFDCTEPGRFGPQSNDPLSLKRHGLSADGANAANAASQPGIPRTRKSENPCPR
jgi:hypothetical protein